MVQKIKTAIFSDVHGNLPALEVFIEATLGNVDDYLCLGDIVNYGPWNNECVDLVSTLPGIQLVKGNHEDLFLNPKNIDGEIPLVKMFFDANFPLFNRFEKIASYKTTLSFAHFTASHTIEDLRIYPDTSIKLEKNWLVGHTHHQFSYSNSGFVLVNPGSVGQNRKFINVIEFAIYDHEKREFSFHSQTYNHLEVISEMKSRNFPQACIDYYTGKLTF
jgi:predicted phosphodiesterase